MMSDLLLVTKFSHTIQAQSRGSVRGRSPSLIE